MREITHIFNVYNIDELKEDALVKAISVVSDRRHEDMIEFDADSFVKSAKAFAERFRFTIQDYSIGFFERNTYLKVDDADYMNLSNEEKNRLVKELNATYLEETDGKCSLTGTYTDCLFFDYFKERGGTSYNTLHKDLRQAFTYALKNFVDDAENTLLDSEYTKTYANETEMEFLESGALYHA